MAHFVYKVTNVNKYICNFAFMTEDRLATILTHFRLSPSQLAQKLGVQRSGISHILSGRNRPGLDFIVKLLQVFPQIDADWLLSGKGSMLREMSVEKSRQAQEAITFPEPKLAHEYEKELPTVDKEEIVAPPKKVTENLKPGSQKGSLAPTGIVSIDKKAEKVIIFYRDGTYEEFVPVKTSTA